MIDGERVCFLYIARHHQVWHGPSVAAAMAGVPAGRRAARAIVDKPERAG
ncbi:hypothetical protein [uncultured Caulobacter sp.]|nr:hypothetical protein [uncultured Caulobacter sp.]